jgi:hypothetical protein
MKYFIYHIVIPAVLACHLMSCGKPAHPKISIWDGYNDSIKYRIPDNDSLGYFSLSPDGNRICVLFKKGSQWHVIINDRQYDTFKATFNDSFEQKPRVTISPGGQRVGLSFIRAKSWQTRSELQRRNNAPAVLADTNQWYVQIDLNIFGGYDGDFAPNIIFSKSGSNFGFVYKKDGKYYVQVGDTTFGPYLKADLAINENEEVYIAYIKDGYASIERVEKFTGR